MRGDPINQAKHASIDLVSNIIDLNVHRVGIIGFDEKAKKISPLSNDRGALIMSIDRLDTFGGTRMDLAISMGTDILDGSPRKKVLMASRIVQGKRQKRQMRQRVRESTLLRLRRGARQKRNTWIRSHRKGNLHFPYRIWVSCRKYSKLLWHSTWHR